jgi:hypothetical protein
VLVKQVIADVRIHLLHPLRTSTESEGCNDQTSFDAVATHGSSHCRGSAHSDHSDATPPTTAKHRRRITPQQRPGRQTRDNPQGASLWTMYPDFNWERRRLRQVVPQKRRMQTLAGLTEGLPTPFLRNKCCILGWEHTIITSAMSIRLVGGASDCCRPKLHR